MYDCANEILAGEGFAGFYRGFGALMVQYALQFAIVRISSFSIRVRIKDKNINLGEGVCLDATPVQKGWVIEALLRGVGVNIRKNQLPTTWLK